MRKFFALLLISVPVFAQDTTFAKEDPKLTDVSVDIYMVSRGKEQLLVSAVRAYKDGDLERITAVGLFSADLSYTHKYGADGKILERHEVDGETPTRSWVYVYNEDGSWKMNGYGYDEENNRASDPGYVETWGKDGKISRAEWKLDGYSVARDYTYDDKGRLSKMEETPEGATKPIAWEIYKYDDAGKLAAKEIYSGGVMRESTSYDGRGDKKEVVRYDGTGKEPVTKSVYSAKYKDFGGGERKSEEVSVSYSMVDGEWVQGGSLKATFSYVYKE